MLGKTADLMIARRTRHAALTFALVAVMATAATGQGRPGGGPPAGPASRWSVFLEGAFLHQFDGEFESGGSFGADRMILEGGFTYAPDFRRSVSVAFGYDRTGYDFEGDPGGMAGDPWDNIHTYSVGAFIRWGFSKEWTVFVIPTLRATAEGGAKLGDALTGGALAGFSYRFGDRLTLGPGIGVISQIEDDPSVFPVLFVNWRITEKLSLETGGGLGATRGPGLVLNWDPAGKWRVFVGGRYEKTDFRLRDSGGEQGGIGSNQEVPVFGGVIWRIQPGLQVNLIGGVELGGKLNQANGIGAAINEQSYQTAGFFGIGFRVRY